MLKLVIAAAFLGAVLAQARASGLSGPEINELLAGGATVELDTPMGTKLPVWYGADGKLAGEAGSLAWYLGAATDRGRWWVEAHQLCHKWNRWFNGETHCLRLSKEGRLIRWSKRDGDSGTARIMVHAPKQVAVAAAGVLPGRSKDVAPPKASPDTGKAPEKRPDAPTLGEGQPSPEGAKETLPKSASPGEKLAATDLPTPPAPVLVVPEKGRPPETKAESKPEKGQAEPKQPVQRVFKVANVRSDDVLNVRSGPSADFEIVGALPPGARGIAITSACRSQWCPVQHHAMSGWVNRAYLAPEWTLEKAPDKAPDAPDKAALPDAASHDSPEAPRTCLTTAVRGLLERIEQQFGPVQVVSTCRPGATIAGTWRPSRHASGNAVDFKAGSRKDAIIAWLIANHRRGGTMTYPGMDHIHVDIGPHFVSIVGGPRWASWRDSRADFPGSR